MKWQLNSPTTESPFEMSPSSSWSGRETDCFLPDNLYSGKRHRMHSPSHPPVPNSWDDENRAKSEKNSIVWSRRRPQLVWNPFFAKFSIDNFWFKMLKTFFLFCGLGGLVVEADLLQSMTSNNIFNDLKIGAPTKLDLLEVKFDGKEDLVPGQKFSKDQVGLWHSIL